MKLNKKLQIICHLSIVMIMLGSLSRLYALPPDPENAALVYYQAFCLYEKPDDTMEELVSDLAKGKIEPNDLIKKYIESCQPAIKLAETAFDLTECDWGVRYSDGLEAQARYIGESKMLAYLILCDARIALSKDNLDFAIQRCLTARKLGVDAGQDPVTVAALVEDAIVKYTDVMIQDVIFDQQLTLDDLAVLKAKLAEIDIRSKPVLFSLTTEKEVMSMYANPEGIRELLPHLEYEKPEVLKNEYGDIRELIVNSTEEFCQKNLAYYNDYWSKMQPLFQLEYHQAYYQMEQLYDKAVQDYKVMPDAFLNRLLSPYVHKLFSKETESITYSNAVRCAVELAMINARTGQLPETLPEGLPKDAFSGQNFEYIKNADGFILCCRGRDLDKDEIHEYEFKVKK